MKHSFLFSSLVGTTLLLSLASCGKSDEGDRQVSSTGTVDSAMMDPVALEKSAPKVEDSLEKVGDKLREEPAFRACIARSTQMCGSEVVSRFVREKDTDEACDIFEDISLKTSCINAINMELARKKADIKFCAKLDESNKANCEQQVITMQATKEKDVSICAKLKAPKAEKTTASGTTTPLMLVERDSQCVMQVLMSLDATEKTLESCKTLSNDMMKQSCISMIQSRIDMQKNTPLPAPIPTPPTSATGAKK